MDYIWKVFWLDHREVIGDDLDKSIWRYIVKVIEYDKGGIRNKFNWGQEFVLSMRIVIQ